MQITVLGKSPAWQDAGGACSGYLATHGGTSVLLDCGNGVFAKLRERVDYLAVDAIVISHMHADHTLDLVPYAYALTYGPRQQPVPVAGYPGTSDPVKPLLLVPPGGEEGLRAIGLLWGDARLIGAAFDVREYDPRAGETVGEIALRFGRVPHYVPTWAVEASPAAGGPRFVFGADSSPNDEIVAFARDADLVMLEATLPRPERGGVRGHLTAQEAGDHARRAGARRLVVTHFSDELDEDDTRRSAAEAFGGPVELAAEGAVYDLGG